MAVLRNSGQKFSVTEDAMESSATFIAPLLLKNLLTSFFVYAVKSVLTLAKKHKLLQLLRCLLGSSFLFLLRLLPSLDFSPEIINHPQKTSSKESENYVSAAVTSGKCGIDSGIARALSQLLSIVNNIPVSSRKYEEVRSLAERIIDDNLQEESEILRELNCAVLSAAFSRTLSQLEAAVADRGGDAAEDGGRDGRKLKGVLGVVRYCGDVAWTRFGKARMVEPGRTGGSAEKLGAEVLWLAQRMSACGCAEEAVGKWASAARLAWLGFSAEPRLQGSIVKVSAFLFKQAKNLGPDKDKQGNRELEMRQIKMKMLMSWLPLLCRASNGVDVPVLSTGEKAELEKALEETIEALEIEEQEKVLSLWLHHFTLWPSCDWPNLHSSYGRWCATSRKQLLRAAET
ncbi:hypothetical protein NMG60_11032676 [Bertholletia excelsa]